MPDQKSDRLRARIAVAASLCVSVAALGVSIWSIEQSASTAAEQKVEARKRAELTEGQSVQFVTSVGPAAHGTKQIQVFVQNYNRLPIIYDEILWPGGTGRHYPALLSCYGLVLTAPTADYTSPTKYLAQAVLYYRTPDGSNWERRSNSQPQRIGKLPRWYPYDEATPTPITPCASSSG